jgi:hypothetical protein
LQRRVRRVPGGHDDRHLLGFDVRPDRLQFGLSPVRQHLFALPDRERQHDDLLRIHLHRAELRQRRQLSCLLRHVRFEHQRHVVWLVVHGVPHARQRHADM